jgi:hypothetical protein
MKKIEIVYRQEVIVTEIIRVPNGFKFKERNEEEFALYDEDEDEDEDRFYQIRDYFDKQCKSPLKLKSNQMSGDRYIVGVNEI